MINDPVIDSVTGKKLVGTRISRKIPAQASTIALSSAVVVSLITLIGWYVPGVGAWLPVSGEAVFNQSEWWRPWSACFAHADVAHLISNLALFVVFGIFLNGYFGFWLFPIWAFVLGGIANLVVLPSYPPDVMVLGASGVVNVLGGLWLSLFFMISRQYRMPGRILRTLGVALLLFAPQEFRPNVAERVHAAGLVCGLIFGFVWFFIFKNRIRSYEIWEEIPPDDPEDELPPEEGVVIEAAEFLGGPYGSQNQNDEQNREDFKLHLVDVEKADIEKTRDEKNDRGDR